jgi:hypothetical protein
VRTYEEASNGTRENLNSVKLATYYEDDTIEKDEMSAPAARMVQTRKVHEILGEILM